MIRHLVDAGGLVWFQDHACEALDRASLERKSIHSHIHTYTYQYVLDTKALRYAAEELKAAQLLRRVPRQSCHCLNAPVEFPRGGGLAWFQDHACQKSPGHKGTNKRCFARQFMRCPLIRLPIQCKCYEKCAAKGFARMRSAIGCFICRALCRLDWIALVDRENPQPLPPSPARPPAPPPRAPAAPPPPQATPPPAPDSGVLGGSLGGTPGALEGARRGYWDPPGGGALGPVLAPKRARIVVADLVFGDVCCFHTMI